MSETFEQKLRRAFQVIQGVKIPDLPEEVIALNNEVSSRYPNTQNMVAIISKNALLAASVLRIANSPAMRPKQVIKTIPQAVAILGTVNLKNMVLASALKQAFGGNGTIREIMDNSVDVAFCMAELANGVHGVSPDEAYLCGLFHNCGAFLLSCKDAKTYSEVFFQSLSLPVTSIEKEEALFNTNHAVVGLLMAKKWSLSPEITEAIYDHHMVRCDLIANEKVRLLVALIKTANGIVSETSMGSYIGVEMTEQFNDGIDTLMLDDKDIKGVRMALQTYSSLGTA
ncbi:MAG: HDOD domain-containing protein [Gammaproteobacteria bacterium]|nr:HDOD domain-containing protein [Gammaproteobacteria bacterium]